MKTPVVAPLPAPVIDDGGFRYTNVEYLIRVVLIAAQLGGAMLLVYAFEIETRTFFYVLLLAGGGFLLSVALPGRLRLRFFSALSVASFVIAVGFDAGSVVIAVGALLIALCHLPFALRWRVALIVLTGAALALLRAHSEIAGPPAAALPVLASMFMFRLALYLHAVRYENSKFSPAHALSYFFMLPNSCFPLFPVVDYQAFVRTRFDTAELEIYEQGVRWIFRGLLQLLMYRLVLSDLVIGERYANDLGDVVQHVLSTFLLYVRVSGQFHLIIGMLHLFGFRLPETHHLYYLSSGFSDFWRRINIYWKDFMVKLVFYPSFFRLRRYGQKRALAASTTVVFAVTWALHSYQQFWVQGDPLISWRDGFFWACFAALVVCATLWETRRTAPSTRRRRRWQASRALTTVGTFLTIAVLWSFWSAESAKTWFYMWTQVKHASSRDWVWIATLATLGLAFTGFAWGTPRLVAQLVTPRPLRQRVRGATVRIGAVLAACLCTVPNASARLPSQYSRVVLHLQGHGIPEEEKPGHIVGYYERINVPSPQMLARAWRPQDGIRAPKDNLAFNQEHSFLLRSLVARSVTASSGGTVSVNRWGMRDREFDLAKPPRTLRIALIGPSVAMGWGVGDHETFDELLERDLDSLAVASQQRVEILNFSVPGWSLAQEVYAMSVQSARFSPDLVLLSVHPGELDILSQNLEGALGRGVSVPDAELSRLLKRAEITESTASGEIARRLRPYEEEWQGRVAMWAAETARRTNTKVAALLLQLPGQTGSSSFTPIRRAMSAAGIPVLDCSDAFVDSSEATLWVSSNDAHPNALGHHLLADCAMDRLRSHPSLLPAW